MRIVYSIGIKDCMEMNIFIVTTLDPLTTPTLHEVWLYTELYFMNFDTHQLQTQQILHSALNLEILKGQWTLPPGKFSNFKKDTT